MIVAADPGAGALKEVGEASVFVYAVSSSEVSSTDIKKERILF